MTRQDDSDPNLWRKRDWHIDKTVSITHLISTIAAIASLIGLAVHFNNRLIMVEQAVAQQAIFDQRQEQRTMEFRTEMRDYMRVQGDKLDRLIERGHLGMK